MDRLDLLETEHPEQFYFDYKPEYKRVIDNYRDIDQLIERTSGVRPVHDNGWFAIPVPEDILTRLIKFGIGGKLNYLNYVLNI